MTKRLLDKTHKAWTYLLSALVRPQELPTLFWQVVVKGVHLGELLNLRRYKAWLGSAGIDVVIDVGANSGQFASAARYIFPDARIYSFEPLADCYKALTKHFSKDRKFQGFSAALGDRRGEVTFYKSSFSKSSSALPMNDSHKKAFPWSAESTPIIVQMQLLDDYIDKIDFESKTLLKIDTQGYEYKVLQGALQTLKRVDYVLAEISFNPLYEGEADFDDIYQLLIGEGFKYSGNLDQLLSPLDQSILQADALFIRLP